MRAPFPKKNQPEVSYKVVSNLRVLTVISLEISTVGNKVKVCNGLEIYISATEFLNRKNWFKKLDRFSISKCKISIKLKT